MCDFRHIIFLVLSAVLNYYFSYNRVIDSGIANVENTVFQIKTSQTVEEGQIVSEKAQDIFRQISIQIESINSQIESIMVATNEQVLGVEQTTQGLQLIDSSMNLNQHTAIGNSTSADKLGELAQEIIKLNSQFNDLLNGNHD